MDMVGEGFLKTLKNSLDEGKVSIEEDQACKRILLAKESLGLFEDPYRYCDTVRAKKELLSESNRAFAREVAGKSFVLLKNDKNILPLKKSGKIAVIGPLADSRRNMLGTWSVSGDFTKAVTVIEGIRNVVGIQAEIRFAKGVNITDNLAFAKKVNVFGQEVVIDERTPKAMIAEAVKIANQSDVIIAVVGEAADMSGESSSMAEIGLQPCQRKFLEALKATGKPMIMVLYNGRSMTLNWESENMDAILDAWCGGTEGANAVTDVIFGDVNPSGKLTTSFPVHVGQIPVYYSMLPSGSPDTVRTGNKFLSNYLDIPNEPLYHFGYGLSYTNIEYGNIQQSGDILGPNSPITCSVNVKNSGSRPGSEIVQMYIRDVVGSISRPMKELKGFEKIEMKAGESKMVTFSIDEALLKFYNGNLDYVAEPEEFEVFIGANSEDVEKVSFVLQ